MKGLKRIPSEKQIAGAYTLLQMTEKNIPDGKLALYSQWTRLDPRLGEILVGYLAGFWKRHNPVSLNRFVRLQVWPSAFGVLVEQTPFYFQQKGMKWDKSFFRKWAECVMDSVRPAHGELFFVDIHTIGSKRFFEEATHATEIYRKWGYFGKDLMINKASPPQRTLISPAQRKFLLERLLKQKKELKVEDYMRELNFQIHRKQAQRDLKNHPLLSRRGNTKNRRYILKKRKT